MFIQDLILQKNTPVDKSDRGCKDVKDLRHGVFASSCITVILSVAIALQLILDLFWSGYVFISTVCLAYWRQL